MALWNYDVQYDGKKQAIEVVAKFADAGNVAVDEAVKEYVAALKTEGDCRKACTVSYEFDMGAAQKNGLPGLIVLDRTLLHNPSSWLLRPKDYRGDPDVAIKVDVTNTDFATGLFPGEKAGTYRAKARHLADMPWTIFGPLDKHVLVVPGGRVELVIVPAKYSLKQTAIQAWAKRAVDALVAYYGKFPVTHALVVVMPRHLFSGPASSYGDGGAVTLNPLPLDATEKDLKDDWVMAHEMVHLALPMLYRRHHWLEEGVATYVEPFARLRTGELNREQVFRDMILGMPKGLPKEGDRGLDNTPTWGRTYWGGALFCLLADVGLREKSKGKVGLDEALRAVNQAGGSLAEPWEMEKVLKVADQGTGYTVLQDLYAKMKDAPYPVDLDALWKKLGVDLQVGGKVIFDDKAPLAFVRKSMEADQRL